jgi:hypothetical protein
MKSRPPAVTTDPPWKSNAAEPLGANTMLRFSSRLRPRLAPEFSRIRQRVKAPAQFAGPAVRRYSEGEVMTEYLVAIYRPENYDPAVSEDEAMGREIDALNDEIQRR